MAKKIIGALIFLILIVVGATYLLINVDALKSLSEKSFEFVEKNISKTVHTSGPLRKDVDDEISILNVSGVIEETNRHRRVEGLSELRQSSALNLSAQKKVDDMFARQYFEHDAPTGEGVGDLVSEVEYEFVIVGENLALGNYRDDATLVQAWMDSPGHRENILKSSYTEIGVAVGRGVFEGKETWLAVQHFAKPLSECPAVNESLKVQIDNNNAQIDNLRIQLDNKRRELEKKPTNHEEGIEYNKKVDEYNKMVNEHNSLIETTKQIMEQYNSQVRAFNSCARE